MKILLILIFIQNLTGKRIFNCTLNIQNRNIAYWERDIIFVYMHYGIKRFYVGTGDTHTVSNPIKTYNCTWGIQFKLRFSLKLV